SPVVGGSKGPVWHEPRGQAGGAPDAGHLERLLRAQRRKDGGEPPSQHRLARSGRTDEEEVVAARGCDLESAARRRLATDLAQIRCLPRWLLGAEETLEIG